MQNYNAMYKIVQRNITGNIRKTLSDNTLLLLAEVGQKIFEQKLILVSFVIHV